MQNERFHQKAEDYCKALARLQDALRQPYNEFIRDSIVQRFEFTYELAWKAMQKWLQGKDIDVRNPKDTLQAGLEQGLIDDGNLWSDVHKMRNLTSHIYSLETAGEVVDFIRARGIAAFDALADKFKALNGAP